MTKLKCLLLIVFTFLQANSFGQNYTSYFTGNPINIITSPQGGICMMGGATEDDEAMKWFLQRSNGGDILVLRATGSNGYNDYLYSQLGIAVNSVETIVCHNAAASAELYLLQKINQAEAIWFAGGDQWDYVSYWRGTAVDAAINNAITSRNIVIGGTSAGMAILGKYYFSAQNGTVSSSAALNDPYNNNVTISSLPFLQNTILNNVITDTHYDNPDRRGRQVVFLARIKTDDGQDIKGIACDEYTAVCIDETGIAKVYGTYPFNDDNAYFLQANCDVANNTPELCANGQPLTWKKGNLAIKVYRVKGTVAGANTFNLNNWKTGNGGSWENWFVINGVLQTAPGTAPSCSIGLPVNLISFFARKNNQQVQLLWQTSGEINNRFFEVQRSKNAASFETIARIDGAGTSTQTQHYEYADIYPYPGSSYYRLKQTDIDGYARYSKIVLVDFAKEAGLSVYPNPCTNNKIFIETETGKIEKISIVNSMGQTVLIKTVFDSYQKQIIDVSVLQKGLYFVRVKSKENNTIRYTKLIIE